MTAQYPTWPDPAIDPDVAADLAAWTARTRPDRIRPLYRLRPGIDGDYTVTVIPAQPGSGQRESRVYEGVIDRTAPTRSPVAPGSRLHLAPRRERLAVWALMLIGDVIAWIAIVWFIMLLWRVWGA